MLSHVEEPTVSECQLQMIGADGWLGSIVASRTIAAPLRSYMSWSAPALVQSHPMGGLLFAVVALVAVVATTVVLVAILVNNDDNITIIDRQRDRNKSGHGKNQSEQAHLLPGEHGRMDEL